uniref:Uncharacterized protein n=1 Tax=viral metagenome TaxID=1070528 RepID=A0A6M3XWW0_9ZZZZ
MTEKKINSLCEVVRNKIEDTINLILDEDNGLIHESQEENSLMDYEVMPILEAVEHLLSTTIDKKKEREQK